MSRTLGVCDHLLSQARRFRMLGVEERALRIFGDLARLRELPADIAEETLLTTRGRPKSRVKVGHEYDGGMSDRSYNLLFDSPGREFVPLGTSLATSNYYPPPVVVKPPNPGSGPS